MITRHKESIIDRIGTVLFYFFLAVGAITVAVQLAGLLGF